MLYKNDNERFIAAIKHIYKHLDRQLTLDEIASHVALSPASLKRLFLEITGQSAGAFIRKIRMELAFKRLHETEESILETALEVGFEDHASFSRCFKRLFGMSPTTARKSIHIINELESIELTEPNIISLKTIELQGITAQGTYWEAAPTAWHQLYDVITHHDSSRTDETDTATYIGISHDNPHKNGVAHDKIRFTAGIANTETEYSELKKYSIKEGTYAQFKYQGKLANLGLAFHYIFGTWNKEQNFCINQTEAPFMLFDRFPKDFELYTILITVPIIKNN